MRTLAVHFPGIAISAAGGAESRKAKSVVANLRLCDWCFWLRQLLSDSFPNTTDCCKTDLRICYGAFELNLFRAGQLVISNWQLPGAAKAEMRKDRQGIPQEDPGIEPSVDSAIQWLLDSQRLSASEDGGSARHYSLIDGWGPSYPETTGYIVPTLIEYAHRNDNTVVLKSARTMADWLVSIQFDDGGFQGGLIDAVPKVPVTFNTGQILLGLASAAKEWGDPYRTAMNRAAKWLVDTQDSDGCWRRHPTPFAEAGEKTYETHVAWGLFEAARVEPANRYEDAALANIRWAMTHQKDNGWIDQCCLSDPMQPLTHTLGYCLRGLLEAHLFRQDAEILEAANKMGLGLLSACQPDGRLPGCLDQNWKSTVDWVCLTGSAQVAHSFLLLSIETGNPDFANAGFALNRYVRRTQQFDRELGVCGGVKGSFPVSGGYGQYQLLNWASKFLIDSNLLEAELRANSCRRPTYKQTLE